MLRRLVAPLVAFAAQAAILLAIPAGRIEALASGSEVLLATAPVDPYDLLSGWYTTLEYEVERPSAGLLPEGLLEGELLFVTVERAEPAWRLVAVGRERAPTSPDRRSLPARAGRGGRLKLLGLDRFYMPEQQREEVARRMREAGPRGLVELRVLPDGTAAVVALRLGEARFGRPLR